jgi:hypothetical protein
MTNTDKDPKEQKEEKIARSEYKAKLVRELMDVDEEDIVSLGSFFKKRNRTLC